MGRRKSEESDRIAPQVWVSFLLHRFDCTLDDLNAQFTLPIGPKEEFVFGKVPEPLVKRTAPKVFQRIYALGANPVGNYVKEPKEENGSRFNLFERVCMRVPESRSWLLEELAPYLEDDVPTIKFSLDVYEKASEALGILLIDDACYQSWARVDPQGLKDAEQQTYTTLVRNPLPISLAFLYALHHLARWNWQPHADQLALRCAEAAENFCNLSVLRNAPEGLVHRLRCQLMGGICMANAYGARSMPDRPPWAVPKVPVRLVVVNDNVRTRSALKCLRAGSDRFYEEIVFDQPESEFWCGSRVPLPDKLMLGAQALRESAASIPGDQRSARPQ